MTLEFLTGDAYIEIDMYPGGPPPAGTDVLKEAEILALRMLGRLP